VNLHKGSVAELPAGAFWQQLQGPPPLRRVGAAAPVRRGGAGRPSHALGALGRNTACLSSSDSIRSQSRGGAEEAARCWGETA